MTNLPWSPAWPRYVRGMNYSPDFVQCVLSSAGRRKYNFGSRRVYSGPNCVPIRNWIENREQFVARKRSKSRLVLGWRPALSFSWKKIIVCTQPLHFSKLDPVDLISVFWYQGKTFRYHISKWHNARIMWILTWKKVDFHLQLFEWTSNEHLTLLFSVVVRVIHNKHPFFRSSLCQFLPKHF